MPKGNPVDRNGKNIQKSVRKKPNPPLLGGLVNNVGRPKTYDDTYPDLVYRLRLMNNTKEEIAVFFGVDHTTLDLWSSKYPKFNEAYSAGGDEADLSVIKALKHKARGYSHKAEKIMVVNGKVEREEYTQHYPPDTAAMSLWLASRQRGKWISGKNLSVDIEEKEETPKISIKGGLPDV